MADAVKERLARSSGWDTVRQLGRGQYGVAYLVVWGDREGAKGGGEENEFKTGDFAVAKVVDLEFLPDKEKAAAFQEANLMRKLRHAHIVSLIDHFLTDGGSDLVIVMDFCDSGDLRNEVKRRAAETPPNLLPEAHIMKWFLQLTLALNYIHQRHILHRDLKSSNIFLTTSIVGEHEHDVKIGDFGIARVLEGTIDNAATVVGTPYYMSPEVCKSEPYGFKSDIWALGCVLYEMCMLKHAFESQSLLGLVYKIVSESYDAIPGQYSDDLRSLLNRVLDKSQFTRPSGQDLVGDPYVRSFAQRDTKLSESDPPLSTARAETKSAQEKLAEAKAPDLGAEPPLVEAPNQSQPHILPLAGAPSPLGSRQSVARNASLRPSALHLGARGPLKAGLGLARGPEPAPPDVSPGVQCFNVWDDQPVKKIWGAESTPPVSAIGSTGGQSSACAAMDAKEFRARVLLRRMQLALSVTARRQNWLQIFASFDRVGNGQLRDIEFEQAVTSMALGFSHEEIQAVCNFLQGPTKCVPVDRFGRALHQSTQEILKFEGWGRHVMGQLMREAEVCEARADSSCGRVTPGAIVRIENLARATALNGQEGVIEKWEPSNSRWVVKLDAEGSKKSLRDENLVVLRPAGSGVIRSDFANSDTTALYRILCEGGENSVPQERFLSVVQRLLPRLTETERLGLLMLLPKTPDGCVDAIDVLAQFFTGGSVGEQTIRMPPLPGAVAGGCVTAAPKSPQAGFQHRPGGGMMSPSHQQSPTFDSPLRPGAPPPSSIGSAQLPPLDKVRVQAEAALLRFAYRLRSDPNKTSPCKVGPFLDVLRLFTSSCNEVRLDEFLDAVSLLPLGISRAEVQIIFSHVRGGSGTTDKPGDVLPFALLEAAAEASLAGGVPSEAPALERLEVASLSNCIQRLVATGSGRTSPQSFRVALMQAQPYLTPHELEWLLLLTDKDGEGQLLPRTLLSRICSDRSVLQAVGGAASASLLPNPTLFYARGLNARTVPQSLANSIILWRINKRLLSIHPPLQLERVLRLFELDAKVVVSRGVLTTLLAQLRLGVSTHEADEVVSQLPGVGGVSGSIQPVTNTVQASSLLEALERNANSTDIKVTFEGWQDAAKEFLRGRGDALAAAVMRENLTAMWIPQAEFRRCLKIATMGNHLLGEDAEDRLVLLAEKRDTGEVNWRSFAGQYADWREDESGEVGNALVSPAAGGTQESWRSQKMKNGQVIGVGVRTNARIDKPGFVPTVKEEVGGEEDGKPFLQKAKCQCCIA